MDVEPERVDLARLGAWMDDRGLPPGSIHDVRQVGGGTQNLLLRFTRGESTYVLRRPPLHLRAESNKNLLREARVLGALRDQPVACPRLLATCDDTSVLGDAVFFLMDAVDGFNAMTRLPPLHAGDVAIRHAMGLTAAAELARVGAVDHIAVGLGDFGRPDGFLRRQVPRWLGELDSYRAIARYETRIPGLDEVSAWLDEHRPDRFTPGILHGDYHLANLMYSPDGPDVAAIVDWEMATVGDPLLDLGWLLATFPDAESPVTRAMVGVGQTAPLLGTTRAELLAEYAAASQRDLGQIRWYAVLACFKLGIVLEGTYARSCAGKAPEPLGEAMHTIAVALFEQAQTFQEERW